MMRGPVLLLESEASAQALLGGIVASAGRGVVLAGSPDEALERLADDRALRLVVVSGEPGLALCRRLRARRQLPYRHVIVLTERGRRQELVEALEAGADEVFAKPVAPHVLIRSLSAAERASRSRTDRVSLREALREAARVGDGELVVRSDGVVARVFFHDGAIAWIAMPGQPSALEAVLGALPAGDADEARAVIDECRRSGLPFDEVVVELGLATRALVEARFGGWLERCFAALLALPTPESLFLPGRRQFAGRFRASLDDLLDGAPSSVVEPRWPSLPPAPRAARCEHARGCSGCGDEVATTVSALLDLDCVVGAVVVHATTGQPLGAGGITIDPDVMAAHVRLIRSLPAADGPCELVLTSTSELHLSSSTSCELAVVSVVASRARAPLGLLRVSVGRIARALGPGRG